MKHNLAIQLSISAFVIAGIMLTVWLANTLASTNSVASQPQPVKNETRLAKDTRASDINKPRNQSKPKSVQSRSVTKERIRKVPNGEFISSIDIVGISSTINMKNATTMREQVNVLWERFLDEKALHTNVDWSKPVFVYAHYHDFSDYATKGTLNIGYDRRQLRLTSSREHNVIPADHYEITLINNNDQLISKWEELNYPINNVVERYQLNNSGEIITTELLTAK